MSKLNNPGVLAALSTLAVGLVAMACGGGEEATPTPRPAVASTATRAPAAVPTATFAPPSPTRAAPIPTSTPAPTATPALAVVRPAPRLTLALASFGPESIRPGQGREATKTYTALMYDWMGWVNDEGALAPGVVQTWQMASDGMTWTLTVRSDMKFHNGEPVTAQDVKFSYDEVVAHAEDPLRATAAATWAANFKSAEVLSPTAVRVNLKRPWTVMPYDFGLNGGPEGAVVPKAYTERVGRQEFDKKPVGSGPWKMVSHDPTVRFRFESTGEKHPYRQTPRYRELDVLMVPEESTRVAMVRTGEADLAEIGSYDLAVNLKRSTEVKLYTIPNFSTGSMMLYGLDDPRIKALPTGKKEVRQALALGINVPEMMDTLFARLAAPATRFLVVPNTLGYDPSWRPNEYNPVRAKELLAQAGYGQGFPLRVYQFAAPGIAWMPRMAEAAAGYWSALGVRTTLVPTDYAQGLGLVRARPQAEEVIGQAQPLFGSVTPTNISFLRTSYHSKGVLLLFNRAEMDALIDQASAALDPQKQHDLIRQVVDLAQSEYVSIPIGVMPVLVAAGKGVADWRVIPSTSIGAVLERVVPKQ